MYLLRDEVFLDTTGYPNNKNMYFPTKPTTYHTVVHACTLDSIY